jgi:prepilin-type N-terminal cleavage/methylation domain-containing protein
MTLPKIKIIRSKKGFTFIELLIVMGILTILASSTIPVYGNMQVASQQNEASTQIIQLIRQAREFSVAGKNDSAYGVFFEENSGDSDKAIFYMGGSFASRNSEYDLEAIFSKSLELESNLAADEVNFSKGLGVPSTIGTITVSADGLNADVININSLGMVEAD